MRLRAGRNYTLKSPREKITGSSGCDGGHAGFATIQSPALASILLVVDRQPSDSGGGSQCHEMVLLFINGISADAIVFSVEKIIDPLFEHYAGSTSKILPRRLCHKVSLMPSGHGLDSTS